ncbi:unnamed protein product [Symbiodinium sp. CCMP2592]|nr:unnamed protein product [Symbiodinium sp. CCMP2592]
MRGLERGPHTFLELHKLQALIPQSRRSAAERLQEHRERQALRERYEEPSDERQIQHPVLRYTEAGNTLFDSWARTLARSAAPEPAVRYVLSNIRHLHDLAIYRNGRQQTHADLICLYQWAWDNDSAKNRLELRRRVWQRLDGLLRRRRASAEVRFERPCVPASTMTAEQLTATLYRKERRKQIVTDALEGAERAAEAGDMHALYQSVRQLAPAAPKERIQIRDAEAVPVGKVPPEVWKQCSADLLPHIKHLFDHHLRPGLLDLPCSWKDGNKREVHERRAGVPSVKALGAAMLSIDMSKAFDQVSHEYLAKALCFLEVSEDTISLILELHRAQYHVKHNRQEGCIDLCNGIRQGCVLSPLLWVCVTTYMLHNLAERSSAQWTEEDVTAFADDFISTFQLHSIRDATRMLQRIQHLFAVLEEVDVTQAKTLSTPGRPISLEPSMKLRARNPEAALHVGSGGGDSQHLLAAQARAAPEAPAASDKKLSRDPGDPDRAQKYRRPSYKGGNQGKGRSWSSWETQWGSSSWDNKNASLSQTVNGEELRELVATLVRLTLRHEDTEAAIRSDSGFMLYLDTQGFGMTRELYTISQEWKEKKNATPPQVTQSLRVTLLTALLASMKIKMAAALQPERRSTLEKHGWVTPGDPPSWAYLRWNPTTEQQEIDPSRPPLLHQDAVTTINAIFGIIPQDNVLHKFHGTRPMAENYQGDTLPFVLMISNRGQRADELHQHLTRLCDNSCMRLVGARLRADRMKRQPLAVRLSQLAGPLLDATHPMKKERDTEWSAMEKEASKDKHTDADMGPGTAQAEDPNL